MWISVVLVLPVVLHFTTGQLRAAGDAVDDGSPRDQRHYRIPDTADHVRIVRIKRDYGQIARATIIVAIEPGYHINANPASAENLIRTTVEMTTPTPLRIVYPKPILFKPKFTDDVLDVYEGTIKIIVEFTPGELTKEVLFHGTLTAQACTQEICLPPAELELPGR